MIGIYVFLITFSYLLISNNHEFWAWDEFSHWGLAIRSIFEEQALWDENSLVLNKTYPPGGPLFQHFMIAHTSWSEATVYRSQTVFVVSSALAIVGWMISSVTGKVAAFSFIVFTPLMLGLTYGVLLPETAQAFLFGAAITIAVTGLTPSKVFVLMIVVFNLILLKDTALLLGTTVIALVWWSSKSGKSMSPRPWKQNLLYASGVAVAVALPLASWRLYLRSIDVEVGLPMSAVSTNRGSENLVTGVLSAVWERISVPFFPTIVNLRSNQFALPNLKLSLLQLTTLILLVHFALVLLDAKSKRRAAAVQIAVIVTGLAVFLLAHTFLYVTKFNEYEALRAAALERYLSVYLIAWFVVVNSLLISHIEKLVRISRNSVVKYSVACLGVCLATGLTGILLFDPRVTPQPPEVQRARHDIRIAASALQQLLKPTDRILFIYQKPAYLRECQFNCGFSSYFVFQFEMFRNVRMSPECFEAYTSRCQFDDDIGEYEYVLVMNPTESIPQLSPLLDTESLTGAAFRIIKVHANAVLGTEMMPQSLP